MAISKSPLTTIDPATLPASEAGMLPALVRLVLIGLGTQLIYVVYIVAFPLLPNIEPNKAAADLEILMRGGYRWFAPVYVAGMLLLYYLFWLAVKTVSAAPNQQRLKLPVLAFGLLFGFTLTWLYPITAIDVFVYAIQGRVWTVHGANAMLVPPNQFPDDPYLPLAGEFAGQLSVYGPLWELLVQIPLRLGAVEMGPAVVSLKLMMLLFFAACALLIGWFAVFRPAGASNKMSLVGLTFFAWNPLVLMQMPGNGHNDMVFMTLLVLGIVLWQRRLWWAAALALALAVTAKLAALLLLPLFGLALLRPGPENPASWRGRLGQAAAAGLIALATILLLYLMIGPLPQVFQGALRTLSGRGFTIAANVRVILREIIPRPVAETLPHNTARIIFILFYLWCLVQLWRNRLDLVSAGFLAYFSQIILAPNFRIWYPAWLVPLAALQLTPATLRRTLLFGLAAELSLVNYFVVWRWWLRDLAWGKTGPLSQYWDYRLVMYSLTVPWLFGLPLFGPIVLRWWERKQAGSVDEG